MSDMILYDWLSDGLGRVSRAVEACPAPKPPDPTSAKNERSADEAALETQGIVDACDLFPNVMMRLWRAKWEVAAKRSGSTSNADGETLRRVFDQTVRVLEAARGYIAHVEQWAGRPVGRERLDDALAEARRIRVDLETNWLWFTKEAEEEAKASIARGEGLDVEEAFAQMAGLSVEELRAKVEAHKRKYHPNGGGAR